MIDLVIWCIDLSPMKFSPRPIVSLTAALLALGCSDDSGSGSPILGNAGSPSVAGSGGMAGTPARPEGGGSAGRELMLPQAGLGQGGGSGSPETCKAEFAKAELQPVYLAFAFDVSGSMGKLDEPHHDPELKWKPVVRATKAFFADTGSTGIRASLTFFPAEDDRCELDPYLEPDVPMTSLPSPAFADAIDAITPEDEDDWRGGTPTMAVLKGTYEFIEASAAKDPTAKYAVVLVSDGYPQGCDDEEDDIEAVAEVVGERAGSFPTYVVGVANPPGGPDTVSNLTRLAVAGGTTSAFLIATGDPERTAETFSQAVDAIRGLARSCVAPIPENPGGVPLDPTRVNVTLGSAPSTTVLGYDAECAAGQAWRFDDPTNPTAIVLCEATCEDVQREPALALNVEFGCARVDVIR